jgi:plastocyanin
MTMVDHAGMRLGGQTAPSVADHAGMRMAGPASMSMMDHAAMGMGGQMSMSMMDHAAMLAALSGGESGGAPAEGALIGGLPSTAGRIVTADARPAETTMDGPEIDISQFQYSLPALTVPAGTTVTWKNHDVEPHTVTSKQRAFGSAGLETDDVFAFRFETPGTYEYFCALHPFMTAQITVQ